MLFAIEMKFGKTKDTEIALSIVETFNSVERLRKLKSCMLKSDNINDFILLMNKI